LKYTGFKSVLRKKLQKNLKSNLIEDLVENFINYENRSRIITLKNSLLSRVTLNILLISLLLLVFSVNVTADCLCDKTYERNLTMRGYFKKFPAMKSLRDLSRYTPN